jgi:hypothetical protein
MPDVTNCYVEYRKNIKELGAVPIVRPWTLFYEQPFDVSRLLMDILYEVPLVSQLLLCRGFSECLPDHISFNCASTSRNFFSRLFGHNSVFIVTKDSSRRSDYIRGFGDCYWRLSDLLFQDKLGRRIQRIQHFYELLELQPSIKDGHLSYPSDEKKGNEMRKDALGMQIQFR